MKNVYDNQEFFNSYKQMRSQQLNANNLIENPIIKSLMPSVENKTILDLGCGDGNMDMFFVQNGAKHVYAIDISKNMINTANQVNAHEKIEYHVMQMEDLNKINEKFDFVYSSLAFHYVSDYDKLIKDISNLLNPGGILLYSQENPVETAIIFNDENETKRIDINGKRYYLVSDYTNESERSVIWNDVSVTKYHRTFCTVVNTLVKYDFKILKMQDSYASKQAIELVEKYKYEKDRPMFLFVKAQKN